MAFEETATVDSVGSSRDTAMTRPSVAMVFGVGLPASKAPHTTFLKLRTSVGATFAMRYSGLVMLLNFTRRVLVCRGSDETQTTVISRKSLFSLRTPATYR